MFHRDIALVRVMHAERAEELLSAVQVDRTVAHGPRSSIRRFVGRSIVRLGAWVAAEPEHQFKPARSS